VILRVFYIYWVVFVLGLLAIREIKLWKPDKSGNINACR